jgi:ACS family D-galactonate transporter-like MFS transporter
MQKARQYYSYSWVVLASVFLSYFALMFQRYDISTVLPSLTTIYHWDISVAGWVNSAWIWSYSVMQIPFGYISERWLGTRITITAGTAMMALGAVLFSVFLPDVPLGIVSRLLIGAGAAAVLVPANSMFARWFAPSKRGLQTAVLLTGGHVAIMCASIVMPVLVAGSILVLGLPAAQGAYFMVALPLVIILPFVYRFTRNRPEDVGLPPIEEPGQDARREKALEATASVGDTLRHSASPYILTLIYAGFIGGSGISAWVTLYFADVYRVSNVNAGILFILVSVVPWLIGVPLSGVLGDRAGHRKVVFYSLLATVLTAAVLVASMATYGSVPLLDAVVLLFVYSTCTSGLVNAWPLTTELFSPRVAGTVAGMMNTGGNLAAALVALVPGYFIVASSPSSFISVFAIGGLFALGGLAGSRLLPGGGRKPEGSGGQEAESASE